MDAAKDTPIRLHKGKLAIEISEGELTGLMSDGREYMHKATSPGWGHSDTEMFPIIGPTSESSYRVQVPRGNAMLDQHGLLRELPYAVKAVTEDEVVLEKSYTAGTPVPNSKFPERSDLRMQIWPYDFRFTKSIRLNSDKVELRFSVRGERDMPFMLGYHPAFAIRSADARVRAGDRLIGMKEVMEVGDRALHIPDCRSLSLEDEGGVLELESKGFNSFMLWSPDPGMLCIEPITFYPYDAGTGHLHEGFDYLMEEARHFTLSIHIQQ